MKSNSLSESEPLFRNTGGPNLSTSLQKEHDNGEGKRKKKKKKKQRPMGNHEFRDDTYCLDIDLSRFWPYLAIEDSHQPNLVGQHMQKRFCN